MPLFWVSLAVFLAACTAGMTIGTLRAVAFFRDLGRVKKQLTQGLEELTRATAQLEGRVGSLAERTAELQARAERLTTSLEQAALLASAVRDVRDAVGRVTGAVPRK